MTRCCSAMAGIHISCGGRIHGRGHLARRRSRRRRWTKMCMSPSSCRQRLQNRTLLPEASRERRREMLARIHRGVTRARRAPRQPSRANAASEAHEPRWGRGVHPTHRACSAAAAFYNYNLPFRKHPPGETEAWERVYDVCGGNPGMLQRAPARLQHSEAGSSVRACAAHRCPAVALRRAVRVTTGSNAIVERHCSPGNSQVTSSPTS